MTWATKLLANGVIWLTIYDRLAGIWSVGKGPFAAKAVKLRAVKKFAMTVSWVASTKIGW